MRTIRRYTRTQWERAFGPLPSAFEGTTAVWNLNPIARDGDPTFLTALDKRLEDLTEAEMALLKPFDVAYKAHELETATLRQRVQWGAQSHLVTAADPRVSEAVAKLQERFAAENAGEVIVRGDEQPEPFLEELGQQL